MVRNLVQPIKSNFITYINTVPPGSIYFIMTVRPSLRMEQLSSYWMDFREI